MEVCVDTNEELRRSLIEQLDGLTYDTEALLVMPKPAQRVIKHLLHDGWLTFEQIMSIENRMGGEGQLPPQDARAVLEALVETKLADTKKRGDEVRYAIVLKNETRLSGVGGSVAQFLRNLFS
jgi:hypothetical protein